MKNDFQPGLSGSSWGALQAPNCVLLLSAPGGCCIMKGLLSIMPHLSARLIPDQLLQGQGSPIPGPAPALPRVITVFTSRDIMQTLFPRTTVSCPAVSPAIYKTPNKDFKSQSNS